MKKVPTDLDDPYLKNLISKKRIEEIETHSKQEQDSAKKDSEKVNHKRPVIDKIRELFRKKI